ncbi:UNVERIFIED_CONTAM: hypothetical protein PYX00_007659 [Menopon gallinae]|uniref:DUF4776 domain-containing protein n=1 Tax=Menopon gallinae TaxID=328185 RepID=A0AAW2HK95_9NEOP
MQKLKTTNSNAKSACPVNRLSGLRPAVHRSTRRKRPRRARRRPRTGTQKGPGYQRHEIQGPGFTASMEVRYPENAESTYDSNCNNDGPTESHSVPTVKRPRGMSRDKRGKSVDSKKDLKIGVKLAKPRKKGRTKFHVTPQITYPGVILGHKYCVNQGPPVPARNGWAWKTTVPYGMKKRSKDWEPGNIPPEILEFIELSREKRGLPPPKVNAKTRRRKSSELVPMPDKILDRPPTLHVHRHKASYHVTMYPVVQPGDEYKDIKQPLKFTINRPENDNEFDSDSDLEFEFNVPEPDTAIQMVNHQTQYNIKGLSSSAAAAAASATATACVTTSEGQGQGRQTASSSFAKKEGQITYH